MNPQMRRTSSACNNKSLDCPTLMMWSF